MFKPLPTPAAEKEIHNPHRRKQHKKQNANPCPHHSFSHPCSTLSNDVRKVKIKNKTFSLFSFGISTTHSLLRCPFSVPAF